MRSYHSLKFFVVFVFLFVGLSFLMADAQEQTSTAKSDSARVEDTVTSAKDTTDLLKTAMEDFHEVMAPLWHEAMPQKDYKTIRENVQLLQEKLMVLIKVKLPDYLQKDDEKLSQFVSKRQELAFQVSQVGLAAADTVDSTLASAFEQMHWAYEEMEKVFAVPIKELDSFHETLYFIWHDALPDKDFKAIKKKAPILKAQIDTLMKVPLPYGCDEMKAEFEKRKTALRDAVYQVVSVCEKGTNQKIDEALNLMHEKFMELNMVLR